MPKRASAALSSRAFLAPYEKALKQAIPASLADLERLLIRNQGQQKRFARLRHLLDEKFDDIRTTMDARRNGNFDAARILVANRKGREVMDEIRAVVSQMDFEEQKLLKERSGRVALSEARILWIAASMATISIAARIFMAVRALRQRAQDGGGSS
ncbi:MAG: CHASE3 domain-containing protein [Acidobacteriota bacterium]|nr:CHASE3 domain-containing protein [Acidobacteriota bacterium]